MRASALVAPMVFFIAACDTSGAHRVSGPPLVGIVVVNAHVTGQRGLSRGKWPLNLDGKYTMDVVPDEPVTIQMEPGDHTFVFDGMAIDNSVLAGLFDLPPVDWCIIQGATRRDVHVSIDTPTKVD